MRGRPARSTHPEQIFARLLGRKPQHGADATLLRRLAKHLHRFDAVQKPSAVRS